jgi:hypothetical protein
MVFENQAVPGCMTEKITNALLADSIPIYCGAPGIFEHFNPVRLVPCGIQESSEGLRLFIAIPRKPSNESETELIMKTNGPKLLQEAIQPCINEVLELEHDLNKFIWKFSQPLLPNRGRLEGSFCDLDFVGRIVHQVMSA